MSTDGLRRELEHADGLLRAGRLADADRALAALRARAPADPQVAYHLGRVRLGQGRAAEAAALWRQAAAARPTWLPPVIGLSTAAAAQGLGEECLHHCEAAYRLAPAEAVVRLNLAQALQRVGRIADALAMADHAILADPRSQAARSLRMLLLRALRRWDEARAEAQTILASDPQATLALALLSRLHRRSGEFAEAEASDARVLAAAAAGLPNLSPLELARYTDDPAILATAARAGTAARLPRQPAPPARERGDGPLTVAYLSPDLRDHAVGHMLMDVLAAHDRRRVRVVTASLVADDGSAAGARLRGLGDAHVDLGRLSQAEGLARLRALDVDVAVDLAGSTEQARPALLFQRVAAVQLLWMGCPVSTGAHWYDAWLVDGYVAPPGSEAHASEPLHRLPLCYHPLGTGGGIMADPRLARQDVGLPEAAPVLAALHFVEKLNGGMVDAWIRIAASHPSAVLWLAVGEPAARGCLRRRAAAAGLADGRLVFADFEPDRQRYLARWRLADLVLDGFPYGGHSTVGEALALGCPVVSRRGRSIASRVAGSMLHHAGLDDLVADDQPAYEELAMGLLRDPGRLAALRSRCAAAAERITATRDRDLARALEEAYLELHRGALAR